MKIIEDSRKNTWDLNELIDEGEIDYTGFTANVGIASVAYFGILLTPFRSVVMIHKGYNYFFNIVKNTIRKALVMLQLNFDQFENLIITKGFQSLDYLQDQDTSVKISEFYGKLQAKLFDEKTGMMKGKRGSEFAVMLTIMGPKLEMSVRPSAYFVVGMVPDRPILYGNLHISIILICDAQQALCTSSVRTTSN